MYTPKKDNPFSLKEKIKMAIFNLPIIASHFHWRSFFFLLFQLSLISHLRIPISLLFNLSSSNKFMCHGLLPKNMVVSEGHKRQNGCSAYLFFLEWFFGPTKCPYSIPTQKTVGPINSYLSRIYRSKLGDQVTPMLLRTTTNST